jgi:diaminohydroxyphosphoribosylaminopyrimidine deaminase/5-amino-6-(5-phosphoribosylamino)uracil reductase
MQDPNPKVAGSGLARLKDAGIETASGLLEAQARKLNAGFVLRMQHGRPRVCLKLAASLDGRTAMASGESQWITGEQARRDVQRLRARSGAIVTGIGTVLSDDPSMNVRLEAADLNGVEPVRQPLRVVMDSRLRLPVNARMLSLPGRTLVLTRSPDAAAREALQAAGAEVAVLDALEPAAVVRRLAQEGINDLLLECGPTLAGAFMAAGLVDELVLYLAPHLMGDAGRGLFTLPGLDRMQDRIGLEWLDVRPVGKDLRVTAAPGRNPD